MPPAAALHDRWPVSPPNTAIAARDVIGRQGVPEVVRNFGVGIDQSCPLGSEWPRYAMPHPELATSQDRRPLSVLDGSIRAISG